MSQAAPSGRCAPRPSVAVVKAHDDGLPESMAGLPKRSARVGTSPPFGWRGPSRGSVSSAAIVQPVFDVTMFALPANEPSQSEESRVGYGKVGDQSKLGPM